MPLPGGTVILFVGMPPRLLTGIAVMPAALAAASTTPVFLRSVFLRAVFLISTAGTGIRGTDIFRFTTVGIRINQII